MYTLKLLIIYSLLYSIVLLPVSVFSADTQEDFDAAASRITTIQATDPTLPNTAGDQKGSIGYVLSRLFDANGKIGNVFLKILGTRSNNAVLRWSGGDTGQFVEGSITDTGTNVGIGTTAPAQKLHISGAWPNQYIRLTATNAPLNNKHWELRHSTINWGDLLFTSINDNNTVRRNALVLKNNGNVGIGTTAPAQKFHVGNTGTVPTYLSVGDNSNERIRIGYSHTSGFANNVLPAQILTDTSGNLNLSSRTSNPSGIRFYTNNGTTAEYRVGILPNGNVGIGTASPQAGLHVDRTSDASLTSTSHALTLGSHTGLNIAIDDNEIIARNGTAASTLNVQLEGGGTSLGGAFTHFSDRHDTDFAVRDTDKGSVSNVIWYDHSAGRLSLGNQGGSGTDAEVRIRGKAQLLVEGTEPDELITKGYVDTLVGSSGSAGAINDLSDAKKNGSSLFLGDNAGLVDDGLNANIGIGDRALQSNIGAVNNIGIGFSALRDTVANNNIAIGRDALLLNTTGVNNVALGNYALDANTTASNSTAVGHSALSSNTTGVNNTALGYVSLLRNTTGNNNTALGSSTLSNNTTGVNNIALGYAGLFRNTTGNNNIALGDSSLYNNTSGNQNIGIGVRTLISNTTGVYNIGVGFNALAVNTTASYNTAVGGLTLDANTTGTYNTALGYNALSVNTTARNNVALGALTLDANTTGENNTAVGYSSLTTSTTGFDNTALGSTSLDAITTGSRNTGVGRAALGRLTTGVNNTALGIFSLDALTTGNDNTGIGYDALGVLTTGNNNIALGDNAGDNITTGSNNIVIGANIDAPSATESNQVNINDLIYGRNGNVGIGTDAPSQKLHVSGQILVGVNNASTESDLIFSGNSVIEGGANSLTLGLPGSSFFRVLTGTNGSGGGTAGGSEALRVISNGNVGIGTDAPQEALHVVGEVQLNRPGATYDVWIQGEGPVGSTSPRNLALLGVESSDRLYVNFNNEYAGGTNIGSIHLRGTEIDNVTCVGNCF